jgi:Ca2+-binding RTX toxin-like protein
LAGGDRIYAGAGGDLVEGGDGDDYIYAGFGDDELHGGLGHDYLNGWDGGSDRLFGEDGDDYLTVARTGSASPSSFLLDGGAGADTLYFFAVGRYLDTVVVTGGGGPDSIVVNGGDSVTIDAGGEADTVRIDFAGNSYTVTLGAGSDALYLDGNSYGDVPASTSITVTDFAPAAAGDVLYLRSYLIAKLTGWDGTANPFGTNHLRLVQDGADTLIRIDADGSAGPGGFTDLVRLQNLEASALAAVNLDGLASSTIHGGTGNDRINGDSDDETLKGLDGDDVLNGGGGNDELDGGAGADLMAGGAGDDSYLVDSLSDVVTEAGGEGTDRVVTALGSKTDPTQLYVLPAFVENLTGSSSTAQGVRGNALGNAIAMAGGNDLVVLDDGGDDTVSAEAATTSSTSETPSPQRTRSTAAPAPTRSACSAPTT